MPFDYGLFGSIAEKIIVLGAGAAIGRVLERRTRLIVYYGHVGHFKLKPGTPGEEMGVVHTHSVIIRNSGRLAANNVRVPHHVNLTKAKIHVSVNPDTDYTVVDLPGGGEELVFSRLAPKQGFTISYLYFPPINWGQINSTISSDEGMARFLDVQPSPQRPRSQRLIAWSLFGIGAITLLYLTAEFARWLMIFISKQGG